MVNAVKGGRKRIGWTKGRSLGDGESWGPLGWVGWGWEALNHQSELYPLYSMIVCVEYEHLSSFIFDNAPRLLQLAGPFAGTAPAAQQLAIASKLLDAVIAEFTDGRRRRPPARCPTGTAIAPAHRQLSPVLHQLGDIVADVIDQDSMVGGVGDPQQIVFVHRQCLRPIEAIKLAE